MLSCLSFFLLLAVALSVDRGSNEGQKGSLVFKGVRAGVREAERSRLSKHRPIS